jgi:serine/threonine protein phosphatase PrpC
MTKLDVAAVTHRGVVRDANEDTIAVGAFLSNAHEGEPVRFTLDSERPVACLVADGLGGHAEGGRASRLAAFALADAWCRFGDPDSVTAAVRKAHELVLDEARWSPSWRGMATTLAGVVFSGGQAICVNVGDSRCYRLGDGMLVQVSTDDSPPLPPGAKPGTVTTVVTQTLGGTAGPIPVDPHVYSGQVDAGDRFLLCSDGLTDYVPLDTVETVLAEHEDDPTAAVRAVLDAALGVGGADNVSVILVTVLA